MPRRLTLVTPPASEPVSLAEAKLHLRVEGDVYDEDALIASLIVAARQYVEEVTGRSLITQTWRLAMSGFAASRDGLLYGGAYDATYGAAYDADAGAFRYATRLARGPVTSIVSITWRDSTGAAILLAPGTYVLTGDLWDATVTPAPGVAWPVTQAHPEAVVITYVAGYGADGTTVPAPITAAIKLLVGGYYDRREDGALSAPPGALSTVDALLAPYRVLEAV